MLINAFYFTFRSFFHSKDIYIFVLTFWSCRKNDLIRKIRLILKIMSSQPGWQTISMHFAFTSNKAFFFLKKKKRRLELVSLPPFICHIWRKIVLLYIPLPDQSHCLVAFTSWDTGQFMYCKCLLARLWSYILKLTLLIKPFFLYD